MGAQEIKHADACLIVDTIHDYKITMDAAFGGSLVIG